MKALLLTIRVKPMATLWMGLQTTKAKLGIVRRITAHKKNSRSISADFQSFTG
jgi:hypothetical protein